MTTPPRARPRPARATLDADSAGGACAIIEGGLLCRQMASRCGEGFLLAAQRVDSMETLRGLAGGESHDCGVLEDGDLRCWRYGGPAVLHGGPCLPETRHLLDPAEPAEEVTIDYERTCVRARSGRTRCIGLTRDTPYSDEGACRPALVVDPEGRPLELARAEVGIGLDPSGDVWVWSDKPTASGGFVARRLSLGPRRFVDVAAGGRAVCLLTAEGDAWCWPDPSPFDHAGLVGSDLRRIAAGVEALDCGETFLGGPTCCFSSADKLWCHFFWPRRVARPALLAPQSRVVEISAGWSLLCVRQEDGAARCLWHGTEEWLDIDDEYASQPVPARPSPCGSEAVGLER